MENIKFFHAQFNSVTPFTPGKNGINDEKACLKWQFQISDTNRDDQLVMPEATHLFRYLKNYRRGKKCIRNLSRSCDTDQDKALSEREVINCFIPTGKWHSEISKEADRDFALTLFRGGSEHVLFRGCVQFCTPLLTFEPLMIKS